VIEPGRALWLIAIVAFVLMALALGCANGDGDDGNGESNGDDDIEGPPRFVVMTYNILFDFPNPDYPSWDVRKEGVAENISRYSPDLIGLQEPFFWQVGDIKALVDGYESISEKFFTDSTILYRADRFSVVSYGSFWLSPTPDEPFSVGFGNFFPRICVWAVLYDFHSDTPFVFSVTHFDNTSPFQETAAPLYIGHMDALGADLPVIAVGDYNSRPGSEAYQILTATLADTFDMVDSYELVGDADQVEAWDPDERIDHIFVGYGDFTVRRWLSDLTLYGEPPAAPSDHWPVVADVEIVD